MACQLVNTATGAGFGVYGCFNASRVGKKKFIWEMWFTKCKASQFHVVIFPQREKSWRQGRLVQFTSTILF
jgi:hypothetical protein